MPSWEYSNLLIYITPGDHIPPHVHVDGPQGQIKIDISGDQPKLMRYKKGRLVQGRFKRKDITKALGYVEANLIELRAKWRDYNGDNSG
jgi:hypothetical protein